MSNHQDDQAADPPSIFAPQLVEVENPANGKKSYPVVSDGSLSWICATGTCTEESYSGYASDVYLQISNQPPTSSTPPEGATHVAPIEGDWSIDQLYGAYWYYYGYGADNYLGAWAHFPSTGWQRTVANFKGLLSSHTYCEQIFEPSPSLQKKFEDVLKNLEFSVGEYSLLRDSIMSAIASALTCKGSGDSLVSAMYMESPYFNSPDHRVEITLEDSPDGQTTVLSGVDPGTGTELELYGRVYSSVIGETGKGSSLKSRANEDLSFRLTCLMSSPIFPSLTAMNWTIHLANSVAKAKGVFRNPGELTVCDSGLDDGQLSIPLIACNDNNLFGRSPIPMDFVIELDLDALKSLKTE